MVRTAWAHTCGCKSRCELVTVSKAKRNCVWATERGKEGWGVNREPMKDPIDGAAKQGEPVGWVEAKRKPGKILKCPSKRLNQGVF